MVQLADAVGADGAVDDENPVQPGREQQPLDALRHPHEDEAAPEPISPPVCPDEYAEARGVDELDATEIDLQVLDAVVDRLGESMADVGDSGRAEPAGERERGTGLHDLDLHRTSSPVMAHQSQ